MSLRLLLKMFSLVLVCSMLGCDKELAWQSKLPKGSTNIKIIDPSYCEFDWRGKHYLYGWDGHAKFMLEIEEEK